jgi:hypothetical protein
MIQRELRPGVVFDQPETALEILTQARAMVTRKTWAQGAASCYEGKCCAGLALDYQGTFSGQVENWRAEYGKAMGFFYAALRETGWAPPPGCASPYPAIVAWNDEPWRTYEEVDEAFVEAIHAAEFDEEYEEL